MIKLETREITEETLNEYLNLTQQIKELESKKEDLKRAILFTYPKGADVGTFKITVKEEAGRRTFKFDDAKAATTEENFNSVYAPFIKVGEAIRKLIVTK